MKRNGIETVKMYRSSIYSTHLDRLIYTAKLNVPNKSKNVK